VDSQQVRIGGVAAAIEGGRNIVNSHPIYSLAAAGASGSAIVAAGAVTSPVLVGAAAVGIVAIAIGAAIGLAKRGAEADFKTGRARVG
jgi:hypothetical protein